MRVQPHLFLLMLHQACKELGLTIVIRAPLLHERALWTEAFLTNR